MRKNVLFASLAAMALLAGVISAAGQEKAPSAAVEIRSATLTAEAQSQGKQEFSWVFSESLVDGKVVKGAPYSAEAVTETTQTLGDGNRIVNRSTATLYRDSEGRTRREQTLKRIGNLAEGEPMQTISITDPVGGTGYLLNPGDHSARKTMVYHFMKTPDGIGSGIGTGAGTAAGGATTMPRSPGVEVTSGSPGDTFFYLANDQTMTVRVRSDNAAKESLGKQMIEGVQAEGNRVTITLPAGAIGNERPIQMVDEIWYSPELQLVVMTRHSDPRSGETIYRLTNINRSEPDHSLFVVPADYTIKEPATAPMAPMKMRKPSIDQ